MIDETIRTFGECLEIAKQCKTDKGKPPKNHLMLGNGFSIDLFKDIFNYKSLVERVESKQVKKLFNTLGTSDFEYVMRGLTDALELVKVYPEHTQIANVMENDLAKLRKILIEVISNSHPETSKWIDAENYDSCYSFLIHFENGNKYTFNYDLLLYWVYMYFKDSRNNRNNKDKKLDISDGFGNGNYQNMRVVAWNIGLAEKQNLYYLHGAMHLFNNKGMIHKLNRGRSGAPIRDQVCNSIDEKRYPMFISEGTTEHKLSRIRDCSYLDHAFHSLKDIKDNLFIFGHSLGDEDDHVFYRINKENKELKNIFISIYGDIDSYENQFICDKVNKWERMDKGKKYYLYDSESANVWGNQANP